jgi:hypothetical protein
MTVLLGDEYLVERRAGTGRGQAAAKDYEAISLEWLRARSGGGNGATVDPTYAQYGPSYLLPVG